MMSVLPIYSHVYFLPLSPKSFIVTISFLSPFDVGRRQGTQHFSRGLSFRRCLGVFLSLLALRVAAAGLGEGSVKVRDLWSAY